MAECIERATAVKSVLRMRRPENSVAQNRMLSIIQMDMLKLPAADVAPVVHCRDCEHSYEAVGGRFCTYGVCVDCEVPEDFFCSYGERKDGGEHVE